MLPGGWALPGPKDILDRTADQINNPHHGYPAWNWSIPVGTPIYAIRGGTVISLTTNPYNCAGQTACNKCGLGVVVEDQDATQWTYCHGSAQHVNIGDTVTAGQQILSAGNTGNSTGPHVHIAIRAAGLDRCLPVESTSTRMRIEPIRRLGAGPGKCSDSRARYFRRWSLSSIPATAKPALTSLGPAHGSGSRSSTGWLRGLLHAAMATRSRLSFWRRSAFWR